MIATQKDLLDYPACSYADNIFGGAIWDMTAFNGKLYISVVTGRAGTKQSFALFRGEQTNDGSWKYTPLVGSPKDGARYDYGFGATRSGAANLVVYKNHLYIGGYNDPMVALPDALNGKFENLYNDMANPVNLWRMDADENFELVVGEDNNKYFGNPIGTIDGESMRAGLAPESAESDASNGEIAKLERMESLMGSMQEDLNAKQTDANADGIATLSAGNAFTYDKYDAAAKRQNSAGLNVGINFNGNTVSDVQYDYASLTAGKDYVVNADGSGISLTSTFLNAQKTGSTGSVTVFFNRGARVKFTVTITDGTPSTPQPSPSPAAPSKPAADKAGKTSGGKTDGTTANTGSAVFGVAFAAAVLVLAAGVMLKLRRRD